MDSFTVAYIIAALWSSTDDEEKPLDENYSIDDLAPEALNQIELACEAFKDNNSALLAEAYEEQSSYGASQAGHDFWLTRNRHGAGFWDRGLGIIGKDLTFAAHAYGECSLYVGDDGKIYLGL